MGLFARYDGSLASISTVDWKSDGDGGATTTFSGVGIGSASPRRTVLVGIFTGQHITSLTIAGVSATRLASYDTGGVNQISIWGASVTSGTTATIVVRQSGLGGSVYYGVYAAYNLVSMAADDFKGDEGVTSINLSLDVPSRGVVAAFAFDSNEAVTITWSGVTRRFNVPDTSFGGSTYSGGDFTNGSGALSSRTVTATASSPSVMWGIAASFR